MLCLREYMSDEGIGVTQPASGDTALQPLRQAALEPIQGSTPDRCSLIPAYRSELLNRQHAQRDLLVMQTRSLVDCPEQWGSP